MITGMFHLAIRTAYVARTVNFYKQVVGLQEVPRPPGLKFPGAWLALPNDPKAAIIHLYGGIAAASESEVIPSHNNEGTADHLCLSALGASEVMILLDRYKLNWRAQNSNSANFQLFFHDPNGIKLELSFRPEAEINLPSLIAPERTYRANERFFNSNQYAVFDA
jgi:catechol 2,3-dioxygenase-like lactoylglutathione lyase family enzyme